MPLLKIEEAEGYMLACVHKIRAIPQWNEILSEGYFYIHIQWSPTSAVSTSTIFSAIGIKLVLVEFLELPMH